MKHWTYNSASQCKNIYMLLIGRVIPSYECFVVFIQVVKLTDTGQINYYAK